MTTPGLCDAVSKYRRKKARQAFAAGVERGIMDCIPAIIAVIVIMAICYAM